MLDKNAPILKPINCEIDKHKIKLEPVLKR